MSLGFMMFGMAMGLVAAAAVWIAGDGVLMACMTYAGCGMLGMVLAMIAAIGGQRRLESARESTPKRQPTIA